MIEHLQAILPPNKSSPLLSLAKAFILAPLALSAQLGGGAFLVAKMASGPSGDPLSVALTSAVSLTGLVFLFTFTLGVLGVLVLARLRRRDPLSWAMTGGAMGAISAVVFGLFMGGMPHWVILVAAALLGWVLFLLLRWFAGVKAEPKPD